MAKGSSDSNFVIHSSDGDHGAEGIGGSSNGVRGGTEGGTPPRTDAQPLRPEQLRLVQEVVSGPGNVIVAAGTGFGKTRVAFAVIEAALEQHPGR
jgi:hypothetical protein